MQFKIGDVVRSADNDVGDRVGTIVAFDCENDAIVDFGLGFDGHSGGLGAPYTKWYVAPADLIAETPAEPPFKRGDIVRYREGRFLAGRVAGTVSECLATGAHSDLPIVRYTGGGWDQADAVELVPAAPQPANDEPAAPAYFVVIDPDDSDVVYNGDSYEDALMAAKVYVETEGVKCRVMTLDCTVTAAATYAFAA